MRRPPPRATLFPYAPLFRSRPLGERRPPGSLHQAPALRLRRKRRRPSAAPPGPAVVHVPCPRDRSANGEARSSRSEEHTSELQSRQYLVCRLLLEKKKKYFPTFRDPNLLIAPSALESNCTRSLPPLFTPRVRPVVCHGLLSDQHAFFAHRISALLT